MFFYPAYNVQDVLQEYAVRYFALLAEGYRLYYADIMLKAQVGDLPHMKAEERKQFYKNLEWASMHPSDILSSNGDNSSEADIKKLLGG